MCTDVLQVTRVRCPDCKDVVHVWSCFDCGIVPNEIERAAFLLEHAEQRPILHLTLLPALHKMQIPDAAT